MESSNSFGIIGGLFYLLFIGFYIYCGWKLFEKAGRPGWEAIIPIYSTYIMIVHLAKKEWWWLLLMFIPLVNFVAIIILMIALAKNFGKSTGFAIGLILLGFIFFPILALGDAKFVGSNTSLEIEDNLVE